MSLPNYLANIKSSGIYRFVWDNSIVSAQQAETLRVLIGYSEKGPFNTPVYIESPSDYITIYGNISKKLERKGIFFHRMSLQALSSGPILALNLKPFSDEKVDYATYNPKDLNTLSIQKQGLEITKLYDTNRFWYLDYDQLPAKIGDSAKYVSIAASDVKDASCTVFIRPVQPSSYKDITIRQWYANESEEMPAYLEPIQDTLLMNYFCDVYVFKGQFTKELIAEGGPLGNYINDSEGNPVWNGYMVLDEDGETIRINPEYKNIYGETEDALSVMAGDLNSNFVSSYQGCLLPYFKDAMNNYISIDVLFNNDYSKHKMLMKLDEALLDEGITAEDNILDQSDLYKEEVIRYDYYVRTENDGTYSYQPYTPVGPEDPNITSAIDKTETGIPEEVEEGSDEYIKVGFKASLAVSPKSFYFEGYTYTTIDKTDSGQTLQKKILDVLNDKGIRTALTNRVDVEYHYIVDTFQSYIESGCKGRLATIAKEKDNAFALLNFPPIPEFIKSNKFTNNITGKFDISLIANASKGFSLPSEANGASYCAFFTQLVFSDGTLKSTVPSAALVSNNFMAKYGARQPYYIVAGPNYGIMSYDGLVGPDYNYGRSDLDVLEPMGVNAIIYVPRKGTFINSNQTAKQTPVSALSKVHIRELVIYLQDEIEAMMQNYQWELNTQTLRDTIKAKADSILETVKNNGGVYVYENVCDSTNNGNEVIDNEMIILDTYIEPARGAGKMVQQLTIYKTGGLSSSVSNG